MERVMMKKPQVVFVVFFMLLVAIPSYLYLSIGPCSKSKIEEGYSNIAEVLNQWEEIVGKIESPKSTGISQGRVDTMEWIRYQLASAIVPRCMMQTKMYLYYGMETRISGYSSILAKASLLDELNSTQLAIPISGTSLLEENDTSRNNQVFELEKKTKNLFIASEMYMIDFHSSFNKFTNQVR
jgi:hypothetical protein